MEIPDVSEAPESFPESISPTDSNRLFPVFGRLSCSSVFSPWADTVTVMSSPGRNPFFPKICAKCPFFFVISSNTRV